MTKTEFLASLSAKYYKVLPIELQRVEDTVRTYLVGVYSKDSNDVMTRTNLCFYVENEGLESEFVFSSVSDSTSSVESATIMFSSLVDAFLVEKVGNNTFQFGDTSRVNESMRKAICNVVVDGLEKRILVSEDVNANLVMVYL